LHVLVTGGTGALGGALAAALLGDGHSVTATWVVEQEAERLMQDAGPGAALLTVRADVLDPDSLAAAVERSRGEHGEIDALVHLVGAWSGGKPVQDHDLDAWRRALDLNLTSAFLACKAVLPGMLAAGQGRIVLVSSRTARTARAGQSAYAVAKAGLAILAETIAEETRGTGVTANVVAPSTIDTPANRAALPGAEHSAWVTPEEVSAAIRYLASESATALRGAWLPVYGGV
jgi:NAD(P)-dependent dehydrogenase (short-subunit alcohol dehydrogenase family)